MVTIVTRAGKGSALTWEEADANFTNLNDGLSDGSPIHSATSATPEATDEIGFWDSSANSLRKVTYADFKPFSSGIDGVNLEQFGMVGDGITDCTAAFNAGLAYAVANNISTMYLPPKNSVYTYRFASKPNAVTNNIRLIGAKCETCVLLRDYTAGSSSEAFIDMSDGGGCEDLEICAANGTTGGIGLVSKPTSTSGFQKFNGLYITYSGTGAWGDACMLLSGALAPDGLRDTFLSNSWIFGKLIIDHCINIGGSGMYAGDVVIRATNADAASDPSAQVALNFIAATSINVSNTYNFFITTAYLSNSASAITIASTAVHGAVMSGTYISDANISNNGTYVDVNTHKTAVSTSSTKATGYSTGAGGSVTQTTSKATGVTLNRPTGRITTHAANLAAGASVAFVFSNSLIESTDTLILNLANQAGNYEWKAGNISSGAVYIYIKNITAGDLAEALTFNFSILKGAAS